MSDRVGANVRRLRQESGWTTAQMAARCAEIGGDAERLTVAVIVNIELGRRDKEGNRRREITVDELGALSAAFVVQPSVLMPELDGILTDAHILPGIDGLISGLLRLRADFASDDRG